mmetsp:Transcript_70187/g.117085  ORF Transcript_70187/g.117085 Transcript_70187/m.117085 type:complete len:335 (+) Transcript_70187:753-1757(+)
MCSVSRGKLRLKESVFSVALPESSRSATAYVQVPTSSESASTSHFTVSPSRLRTRNCSPASQSGSGTGSTTSWSAFTTVLFSGLDRVVLVACSASSSGPTVTFTTAALNPSVGRPVALSTSTVTRAVLSVESSGMLDSSSLSPDSGCHVASTCNSPPPPTIGSHMSLPSMSSPAVTCARPRKSSVLLVSSSYMFTTSLCPWAQTTNSNVWSSQTGSRELLQVVVVKVESPRATMQKASEESRLTKLKSPASTFLMPLASWMVTLMTPSGGSYRAQNMFRAAVSVDNWTGMRLGSTSNCCSCVFTTCRTVLPTTGQSNTPATPLNSKSTRGKFRK